jgi:multiple sugar transport system substrate-binding protein
MSRRRLLGTGLTAVAAGPLAACGAANQPSGQGAPAASLGSVSGQVQVWHYYSSQSWKGWLKKTAAQLKEKAPRVDVQPTQVSLDVLAEKVTAAAVAGTPPDVVAHDSGTAAFRGKSGEAAALDARMTKDRVRLADLVDYQGKEVTFNGKVYGLPFRPDTRILYYNKKLLRDASLDPNKPPATWDELWTMAERLTKRGGPMGYEQLGFYPTLGNTHFTMWAWTAGAEFVDAKNVPTINTREAFDTLEWYVRWVRAYDHAAVVEWNKQLSPNATSSPFFQEKLPLMVQTNGFSANLPRNAPTMEWGTALVPSKIKKASWGAGADIEMPAAGKNQDAAWEVIKYLNLDPEVNRQAIRDTAQLVAPMAVNRAEEFTKEPFWKTVVESLAVTRHRPQVVEAPDWWRFTPKITAVQEGKLGAREALDQAQAEAMAQYNQNKK